MPNHTPESLIATIANTTDAEVEQMNAAFKAVQNVKHWKFPIDAVINESDRDITARAIEWFAGCGAEFAPAGEGKLRVTAIGYYAAIGA